MLNHRYYRGRPGHSGCFIRPPSMVTSSQFSMVKLVSLLLLVAAATASTTGGGATGNLNKDVSTGLLRAEIISTNNCHLDLRPALKEFLSDSTNGAQSYNNVNVVFLPGHRPVMTIIDDTRTKTGNVVESIQLWNIQTTNELHDILKSRGFIRLEESATVVDPGSSSTSIQATSAGSNPKNEDTTTTTNKAAAMEAARNAFRQVEKSDPEADTYTKSYAAMRAYLDASTNDNNAVDTRNHHSKDPNHIDATNSYYYEMAELIHQRLQDSEENQQQKGSTTLISAS